MPLGQMPCMADICADTLQCSQKYLFIYLPTLGSVMHLYALFMAKSSTRCVNLYLVYNTI